MQHDHVLNKVEFWPIDPIPKVGDGICGQTICNHYAAFLIPFNLVCNMIMSWKCWILNLLTPTTGSGGEDGVCRQNICNHAAAFVILFNLICSMTMFCKSWILTIWPQPRVRGRVGFCGQHIFNHAAAFVIPFNLICNMTMFWKGWISTGVGHWPWSKTTVDMFHICYTSVCMRYFSKNIDNWLGYWKI